MYKMMPDYNLAAIHARDYKKRIKDNIDDWLKTETGTGKKLVHWDTYDVDVYLKVKDGSLTKWYLEYLKTGNHLEELLYADMNRMLAIIKLIDLERQKRNLAEDIMYKNAYTQEMFRQSTEYSSYQKGVTKTVSVDHFCSIMHDIFVDNGYAKNGYFKRDKHVTNLRQRICPCCGRSFIYTIEPGTDPTNKMVKPQVDHFLPKSIYPWFGMTYFNLIPICTVCNLKDCKGENDPLTKHDRPFRIIYPYEYDPSMMEFTYTMKGCDYNSDDNWEVSIDYKGNDELEEGSRNIIHLDGFYKYHNHEIKGMYHQLLVLASRSHGYYPKNGIEVRHLRVTPRMMFGFPFNDESSKTELLYKFKYDIYHKMITERIKQLVEFKEPSDLVADDNACQCLCVRLRDKFYNFLSKWCIIRKIARI